MSSAGFLFSSLFILHPSSSPSPSSLPHLSSPLIFFDYSQPSKTRKRTQHTQAKSTQQNGRLHQSKRGSKAATNHMGPACTQQLLRIETKKQTKKNPTANLPPSLLQRRERGKDRQTQGCLLSFQFRQAEEKKEARRKKRGNNKQASKQANKKL